MKVKVRDLKPNPFRDMARYPIDQEKVATLVRSIRTTTFWDNLLARKSEDGEFELAYGHHRLLALKKALGPDGYVDIPVRDLSDELMLKVMANENMEQWGSNAVVEQETVRSVVLAYAAGKIELEQPSKNTPGNLIRFAPWFRERTDLPPDEVEHPYTVTSVGKFLGWMTPRNEGEEGPKDSVLSALKALEFIEEGILTQGAFEGLSSTAARHVVDEARKSKRSRDLTAKIAEREAEAADKDAEEARADGDVERRRMAERRAYAMREQAKEKRAEGKEAARDVGKAVSKAMKAGTIGQRHTDLIRADVEQKYTKAKQPPPWIDSYAHKLARDLNKVLGEKDPRYVRFKRLAGAKQYIAPMAGKDLISNLERLAERATEWAKKLEGYGSMYTNLAGGPRAARAKPKALSA